MGLLHVACNTRLVAPRRAVRRERGRVHWCTFREPYATRWRPMCTATEEKFAGVHRPEYAAVRRESEQLCEPRARLATLLGRDGRRDRRDDTKPRCLGRRLGTLVHQGR